MKISKINCMELIAEKFPGFRPLWDAYTSENKELEENLRTTLWGEMGEFSHYVSDLLINKELKPSQVNEIFTYMEYLLINGDEDVQNAVCTCFIENILNRTPEQIDPKLFVSHLGPKSREYALAWDEFTGVQTEGLKIDNE